MPVAHQPLAAVIGELVGMAADQGGNLRLDGLRQQRSRAVAQHLGQRIGECSWLGELENISLCHGVSLLRWRCGSFEHPHDTPPYPFMPSPTFVDSSVGDHYEVKVDGEWTPVPNDRINNVVAPDGGAHVCAPPQKGSNKGVLFCVVLPPEG